MKRSSKKTHAALEASGIVPATRPRVHSFHLGSTWLLSTSKVVIQHLVGPGEALVQHLDSGHVETIPLSQLKPVPEQSAFSRAPYTGPRAPEVWDRAVQQARALEAFVEAGDRSAEARKALAERLHLSDRQVGRKLKRFEEVKTVEAALPERRGPRAGSTRLHANVEVLLRKEIERLLAVSPSITAREVHGLVTAQLRTGQRPPGIATVVRRLRQARKNLDLLPSPIREEAKYRVKPLQHRDKATFPLELVQIDHTVVDVHLVHPLTRRPIGRPVLTLMVDEGTRVVLGMNLSLEAPSRLAVGLCLLHGVQQKDEWLAELGEPDLIWPGYGLPRSILSDNGSEFHAASLRMSCEQYGIGLRYRPPGDPAVGGLIERAIGTMMGRLRLLPGASYSELLHKAPRRADKLARMTLGELTHYLALQVSIYHQTHHTGLGMTPAKAWELGWKVNGVVGAPRLVDPHAFRMSFLPGARRHVVRGAVRLWNLTYAAPELRSVDGAHMARYDPRDMSRIYVEVDGGHAIAPLADPALSPFSLWEARALRKHRKTDGGPPNPAQLERDLLAARDLRECITQRGTVAGAARSHARQLEWQRAQRSNDRPGVELPPQPSTGASGCRVEGDE